MKKLFLAFFIYCAIALFFNCSALTITEQYKLQEMCSTRAKTNFIDLKKKFEIDTDMGYEKTFSYTNHYNIKANKCFQLFTDCSMPTPKEVAKKSGEPGCLYILSDVNENRQIGVVMIDGWKREQILGCTVEEKKCASENEWNSLIKPYMEE